MAAQGTLHARSWFAERDLLLLVCHITWHASLVQGKNEDTYVTTVNGLKLHPPACAGS
jgi:hypothetical protein